MIYFFLVSHYIFYILLSSFPAPLEQHFEEYHNIIDNINSSYVNYWQRKYNKPSLTMMALSFGSGDPSPPSPSHLMLPLVDVPFLFYGTRPTSNILCLSSYTHTRDDSSISSYGDPSKRGDSSESSSLSAKGVHDDPGPS